jgi:pimeloyl-ACP methyl ester carboxylesterase
LLNDMADDAIGLLDALGIGSAHVVGASMGGAIAQLMAIRNPSRVRTLTSIMASSGEPTLPPPTPAALQVLLTPTPPDYDRYLARYLSTWKVLRVAASPQDEARDPARARRAYERGLKPGRRGAPARRDHRLGQPPAGAHEGHHADARDPRRRRPARAARPRPGRGRRGAGREDRDHPGHGPRAADPLWPQIIGAIAAHTR